MRTFWKGKAVELYSIDTLQTTIKLHANTGLNYNFANLGGCRLPVPLYSCTVSVHLYTRDSGDIRPSPAPDTRLQHLVRLKLYDKLWAACVVCREWVNKISENIAWLGVTGGARCSGRSAVIFSFPLCGVWEWHVRRVMAFVTLLSRDNWVLQLI